MVRPMYRYASTRRSTSSLSSSRPYVFVGRTLKAWVSRQSATPGLDQLHAVAVRIEQVDQQTSCIRAGGRDHRSRYGPVPERGRPVKEFHHVDTGKRQVRGTGVRPRRIDGGRRIVNLHKLQVKRSITGGEEQCPYPHAWTGE